MELARIMAKHKPAATIMFLAVAGEEQGLYGANYTARLLASRNANVEGMWTNDSRTKSTLILIISADFFPVVGSPIGDDGKNNSRVIRLFAQGIPSNETTSRATTRLTIGGENDSPARQLGRFTRDVGSNPITGMSVEVIYRLDRYLRGGDHRPFLEAGYAGNRFTEPREDFAHQHQNVTVRNGVQYGDLPEFCDFYYISRVGKVTGAAVWSLAQAPDTPKNVRIDTVELTNDSTLKWSKVSGAKGYDVVWRPTNEAVWTQYVEVGDVETATVKASKDNVIFGVRSVGANGFRSPAVFPFPS